MGDPVFFKPARALGLGEIAALVGATAPAGPLADLTIDNVAPLDQAGEGDLSFIDNPQYLPMVATTRATACLVAEKFADRVPAGTVAIVCAQPYRALALVLQVLFPDAMRPQPAFGETGISPAAHIHPTARLEAGVTIEPNAVVGRDAEIGSGTVVGAGAVIAAGVRIGRNCSIGAGATLQYALLGNRVIVHPGVRIGQDGFGFAMGPGGHLKVPQIGRVVIQDDVEIGANTTIDRGANRDTIIGEGTKIDNGVQIGHNAVIGRHCVIVAQVGIAGSAELGDFVALGGQAGVAGHIKVGAGAQIAGSSSAKDDVPAGARYMGTPAKPLREWMREMLALRRLVEQSDRERKP
jgi:UDP-3-O-[3-hydroxymyristoyl] glucosamine N-acyltransferase